MALIFNLHQLIDMMSIGTLLAYTIVAICVLVLRYQDDDLPVFETTIQTPVILKQLLNMNFIKYPNNLTSIITKVAIVIFSILSTLLCVVLKVTEMNTEIQWWTIVLLIIIGAGLLLTLLIIYRQPVSNMELTFKVPLVPILPCLSVLINLYLMFQLDVFTWIRFLVWLVIGYIIYFSYGIHNSQHGIIAEKNTILTLTTNLNKSIITTNSNGNNSNMSSSSNNRNQNSSYTQNGNNNIRRSFNGYADGVMPMTKSKEASSYDVNTSL